MKKISLKVGGGLRRILGLKAVNKDDFWKVLKGISATSMRHQVQINYALRISENVRSIPFSCSFFLWSTERMPFLDSLFGFLAKDKVLCPETRKFSRVRFRGQENGLGQGDFLGFLRPEALLDQLSDHVLRSKARFLQLLVQDALVLIFLVHLWKKFLPMVVCQLRPIVHWFAPGLKVPVRLLYRRKD